ncbi:MAG TPA: hypothetical protein PLK76_00065 [bacterium]|nr:hypothetical protein [bacterium]
MEKADDEKLIRYFFTIVIVGLLLLIFGGLRNIPSYLIFAGFVFVFVWEIIKLIVAGINVT